MTVFSQFLYNMAKLLQLLKQQKTVENYHKRYRTYEELSWLWHNTNFYNEFEYCPQTTVPSNVCRLSHILHTPLAMILRACVGLAHSHIHLIYSPC